MVPQRLPEIQVIAETETELEPLYQVIIHNDPVTPMDFVVHILKTRFYLSNDRAANIMFTAHMYNSAYVQTVAKSTAEKRLQQAHAEAHNATIFQIALAWVISQPRIITIPMSFNLQHIRENFEAAELVLTTEELAQLDKL